jgi:hypothetical protein
LVEKPVKTGLSTATEPIRTGSKRFGCSLSNSGDQLNRLQLLVAHFGVKKQTEPDPQTLVSKHLEIKFPDHHPDIPHSVQHVYDTACMFLHSPAPATQHHHSTIPVIVPMPPVIPVITETGPKVGRPKSDFS